MNIHVCLCIVCMCLHCRWMCANRCTCICMCRCVCTDLCVYGGYIWIWMCTCEHLRVNMCPYMSLCLWMYVWVHVNVWMWAYFVCTHLYLCAYGFIWIWIYVCVICNQNQMTRLDISNTLKRPPLPVPNHCHPHSATRGDRYRDWVLLVLGLYRSGIMYCVVFYLLLLMILSVCFVPVVSYSSGVFFVYVQYSIVWMYCSLSLS
jgi:hypothetical protein